MTRPSSSGPRSTSGLLYANAAALALAAGKQDVTAGYLMDAGSTQEE